MAGPIHPIQDTDARFSIDPITRAIKNETLKKLYLVINDKNSEVFTFELPRYGVEGHDMAACNKVEVHFVNANSTTKEKSAAPYRVTDYGVDPDDPEKMTFSWTITEKATKFPGSLAFAVHFACIDELTEEVHYWWSTATNTTITVLDCIDLTPEDGEEPTDLQEKTATPSTELQVLRPDGDFRGLSKVLINPIPEEFIAPTGTLFVDANGNYSVREYDQVLVRVPDVPPVLQEKEITANGTHTPDTGYEGFSQVTVNVADAPALQEKTAYPSTSEQTVEPDDGFTGLSKVTVGAMRLQSKSIDQNGEVIADSGYDGLSKVTIRVQPSLQDKTLTLSENGETEVIADSGYYGLDKVRVRVNVETDPVALQEKTVVANGTFTPDAGFDGFSKVYVEVASDAPSTEEATVTPTLDTQEVLPAAGKLLSKVTVRPIPAEYMKPEGTATLRANGEYDIAGKAKAVVDVPTEGGGECSGEHINMVEELPENGVEGGIYGIRKFNDVAMVMDGQCGLMINDTNSTNPLYTATSETFRDLSVPEGETTIFVYVTDIPEIYMLTSYSDEWFTLSDMYGGLVETEFPCLGVLTNLADADTTKQGYYIYLGVQLYKYINGQYKVLYANGELIYSSNGDGTCTVAGIQSNHPLDLVIPSVSPNGDTVTKIETLLFEGRLFSSITIPNTVTTLQGQVFEDVICDTMIIENGITDIGYKVFQYAQIATITIPDTVKSIGSDAFAANRLLTEIVVPSGVTEIEDGTFSSCKSLETVTLSNDTTSIGGAAFYNCRSLKTVTLGNSLTNISGYGTFRECRSLNNLILPASVTDIGKFAFENCTALTNITFNGTIEQWNAITFGTDWNLNVPATKVTCSDGEVTL